MWLVAAKKWNMDGFGGCELRTRSYVALTMMTGGYNALFVCLRQDLLG